MLEEIELIQQRWTLAYITLLGLRPTRVPSSHIIHMEYSILFVIRYVLFLINPLI